MQKRRSVLVLFVICALFCLGFGYAALTDSLVINGSATSGAGNVVNETVFDIQWTGVTTPSVTRGGSSTLAATATASGNTAGTLTITNMSVINESVSAVYTVKNMEKTPGYKANVTATIEVKQGGTPVALGDLPFTITALFGSNETTVINNNATAELTVLVEMDETILSGSFEYTITITLNATAAE